MLDWISESYINPNGKRYKMLTYLNKWRLGFIILLFIVSTSYPIYCYQYYYFGSHSLLQEQTNLINNKEKLSKLLDSIKKHHKAQKQQNSQFTQISQHIQQLLDKYHINIENMQWDLEQESILSLTVNQESKLLFELLSEINQIKALYAKEIILTKLYQERLVQLNATFILAK